MPSCPGHGSEAVGLTFPLDARDDHFKLLPVTQLYLLRASVPSDLALYHCCKIFIIIIIDYLIYSFSNIKIRLVTNIHQVC